jgi:hypothetical protein
MLSSKEFPSSGTDESPPPVRLSEQMAEDGNVLCIADATGPRLMTDES